MYAAFVIAWKDLVLLSRDRVTLFWVVGFPLVFALFFGAVLGATLDRGGRVLEAPLVVEPDASAALVAAFESAPALALERASLDDARERVRRGDAAGYLRLRGGGVEIGVDPSRETDAAILRGVTLETLGAAGPAAPGGPPGPALRTAPAIAVVEVVGRGASARSVADLVFPAAVLWGLMGCAASFAVAMVVERSGGTYARLASAPFPRATVLAGKALACFAACLLDAGVITGMSALLLGVRFEAPLAVVAATVAASICFVGMTVLLSVLGRTQQAVSGSGWGALILMAMLGGAMVPVSAMPPWLQTASYASPVRWGIVALEGALFRGFTARELALPSAVLVGAGALSFLAGLCVLSRQATR
ncbi:MAG: ABC transporter permease [Polyangiaceae bacterium]|nr:ABC transporter permease [Polyangiaceae bacterium]